ncbi:MAG: YceD family protein, partial [Sedimenticolaceae bacterium]
DADRRRVIESHVEGELQIICQRCLGAMPLPIDSDWQLAVVTGFQQAEQLPEEYDPLLVEEDTIVLRDLIEDELILAVPSAARHEPDQCAVQLTDYQEEVEEETEAPEASDNPFAVLAQMKSKGSDVN